jgi:hypothetical protein
VSCLMSDFLRVMVVLGFGFCRVNYLVPRKARAILEGLERIVLTPLNFTVMPNK